VYSDRCLWHPSFNEGTTSSITAQELQTKESCEPGKSTILSALESETGAENDTRRNFDRHPQRSPNDYF
jgi:hypothetical protein